MSREINIERSTSIFCAAACGISSVMLGVGEEHYGLAAMAVVVAIGSTILCDKRRWFVLNNWQANVASLVVLAYAFVQARNVASELRILVMADLMAHLQFILQFKTKNVRTYWLLVVISFLQTAVAAALHTGVMFGLLLVVYLMLTLYFMGYFYLYREQLKFASRLPQGRGSNSVDLHARTDLSRRLYGIGLGTLALSAFFFVAMPRIGQTNWVPAGIVDPRTVGFSPEINLTRSGDVFQDPEVVMQVRFFDYKTGAPRQIDGDIYMRGAGSWLYEEGKWRTFTNFQRMQSGLPSVTALSSQEGLLRQQVTIEPLSRPNLFACFPVYTDRPLQSRAIFHHPANGQIMRNEALKLRRFDYEVLTPGFQRHKQNDLLPAEYVVEGGDRDRYLSFPRIGRAGESNPLAQLRQTATDVVAGVPATDPFQRAKRIEAYLRDSGRFKYSLESGERPPTIDPLEHFITERPEGHCEFFAGALAMMLRSVGIPSRVVIGFRGGQYNVVGGFYEFQQLHAHSWVEAYLPPGRVPLERLQDTPGLIPLAAENGAWLQLDATPAAGIDAAADYSSTWLQIQQTIDYVKFLWNNYVVGMDSMRQEESIYEPVMTAMAETTKSLTDVDHWEIVWARLKAKLTPLRTLSAVLLVAGVAGLVVWIWPKICARLPSRRSTNDARGAPTARRPRPPVEEFYRRLEGVLARVSLTRTADQTQREFALAAGGELAELPHTRGAAPLPRRIVDHYYRVRFGNRPLNDSQRADVEHALDELAAALPLTPGKSSPGKQTNGKR
ncbi:MAG: DUF3488 domain-containing protein [Planctomycetaceae bacterium]|nr:DUF3488 domain-containing protein [Planctomycetaceae bacterium]